MIDEYQRSSLHYVCIDVSVDERTEATNKLLFAGEDVNAQDKKGWTPLHFAAQEEDVDVAQILIRAGADIELTDINGNTPLWVATMNAQEVTRLITVLLEHGADPNKENNHGVSPMDISPEFFSRPT